MTDITAADETAGGSGATQSPEAADSTADTGVAGGSDTDSDSDVDCSGRECTVTLTGDGAQADILGTSVVLGAVGNGQVTFRIGDRDVSCGQGDSVSAGPLTLACTTVTDDSVTMTASLG